MLGALLNGKIRSHDTGFQFEDIITSTVFERMRYLSPPVFWSIICETFPELPTYQVARIIEYEFWPKWELPEDSRWENKTTEPDMLIQIVVGDPAQSFHIILEAKANDLGISQDEVQLRKHVVAYEKVLEEVSAECDQLYLLAIGGKPIPNLSSIGNCNLKYGNWSQFYSAFEKNLGNPKCNKSDLLVINDVCSFLAWRGFMPFLDMSKVWKPENPQFNIENLSF